jgi:hypothetical protein
MSTSIHGVVKNGVVVPDTPLPEAAHVEIRLNDRVKGESRAAVRLSPLELRKMPREQRQAILLEAAKLAEHDYHFDKELTGFEAFSEEELNDDESDGR